MKRLCVIFGLLASVFSSLSILAHTRSQSFSHWNIENHFVEFTFAVDARRVTQLSALDVASDNLSHILLAHLQESISVIQGTASCELVQIKPRTSKQSTIRISGKFKCPVNNAKDEKLKAIVTAFQAVSPTHIHIARIEYQDNISETVIRQGRASFNLKMDKATNDLSGFISTGFMHVVSGLDHLLFLLALVLVAIKPRIAVYCITGFTIGHSIALALATLGWIVPNEGLIEALIGFTIAITALEAGIIHGLQRKKTMYAFALLTMLVTITPLSQGPSLWFLGLALAAYAIAIGNFKEQQAMRSLPLITTAFGLIHGAGFAGGLKEATLFQSEIFIPLLGFNIGVELAQLCALVLFFGIFAILKSKSTLLTGKVRHVASVIVFGLGCYWYASRLWL